MLMLNIAQNAYRVIYVLKKVGWVVRGYIYNVISVNVMSWKRYMSHIK